MRRCLGGYGAHRNHGVTWTQRQFSTSFGTVTGSELAKALAGAAAALAVFYAFVIAVTATVGWW